MVMASMASSAMMESILTVLQLPFGVVVGAAAERLCRRCGIHARLRNTAVKFAVAFASASLIVGHQHVIHLLPWHWQSSPAGGAPDESLSRERIGSAGALISLAARVVVFAFGTVIGAALQPVGLTGGIATGKSTVSSLLQSNEDKDEEVEFVIIDVDSIAHDILLPKKSAKDESVYDRLVQEFGTDILSKEEEKNSETMPNIDRRKLGDLVFRDRQKRRKLNSITHPKIIKIMFKRILSEGLNIGSIFSKPNPKSSKLRVVCVDIPLLFEGGLPMLTLFGTKIVVACNPELQLERLHSRNPDLTLEQCRQRIASQIPVEDKARRADVVIRNDGSLKDLKNRVCDVKRQVAGVVSGSQRGVELSWWVAGVGGLLLFGQCAQ